MIFSQFSRMLGSFPTLEAAGHGLDQLILSGFPVEKVFLFGRDLETLSQSSKLSTPKLLPLSRGSEHLGAVTGTPLGLTKGLLAGNVAGGTAGVALSLGVLALPGIGQIALTSALILTAISFGLGTAAGGIIGALIGLGITEKQAKFYSQKVSEGHYLLIVKGSKSEIACAERILSQQGVLP